MDNPDNPISAVAETPDFTVEHRGHVVRFYRTRDDAGMDTGTYNAVIFLDDDSVQEIPDALLTAERQAEIVGQTLVDGRLASYSDSSIPNA